MLFRVAIPETANFGPVFDFSCQTSHALPGDDKGGFQVHVMRVETNKNKKECRIQVYWTCQIDVDSIRCENQESLTTKLKIARDYCIHYFEASLTPKAKRLFNPVQE